MDETTTTKKGNNMGMILLGVALLLLVGGGIYFMTQSQSNTPQNQTQESMEQSEPTEDDSMMDSGSDTNSDTGDEMVEGAQTIELAASNFEFSQKEIRVKQGDTVRLTLTSSGGTHDWVVDELNARTEILGDGESETIEFVADKAGTFEYYCSVGQHRQMGMVGNLIVE